MTAFLLELKERWSRFFTKYEKRVMILFKFSLTLTALILLTHEVGFMSFMTNPLIIVPAALLCAFTPGFVTVIVLAFFMVIHLYALSAQLAVVVVIVLLIMFLLFFRFCPKAVYAMLIAIFCFCAHIPYVLPVILGLVCGFNYIFTLNFGIVLYYILHTVNIYQASLTRQTATDNTQILSFIAESVLTNRAMFAVIIAFSVTFILVNLLRRTHFSYAWSYSIIAGIITQFILLVIMDIWLGSHLSLPELIIGSIICVAIAFILNVLILNLDYTRTETVQFEDDEYQYFVKAVPKRNIAVSDVKVTHINAKDIKDITLTDFSLDLPDDTQND